MSVSICEGRTNESQEGEKVLRGGRTKTSSPCFGIPTCGDPSSIFVSVNSLQNLLNQITSLLNGFSTDRDVQDVQLETFNQFNIGDVMLEVI